MPPPHSIPGDLGSGSWCISEARLFLFLSEATRLGGSPLLRSAQTYTYLFSHPSLNPFYPSWVGADHADELPYVFGKPFDNPLGYRVQDRTVSQAMIAYWTNLARTGDPNKGHSAVPTQWDPYTQENGNYLEINKKMNGQSLKQHLRSSYLQYWTHTYQALPTVTGDGATPLPPSDDTEAVP
ncbi:hypothetical protein QTO34_005017 [Cnephaeus nilssonii]|uniref:Carboxylesterase type B domain-containing protein n=1 Tax=Cnephaeus nilssonii TaxID=3371016 RepID=A0AA40LJM7_CNENI|nr:hypothetical protein QTO34_005017 [Eptesicus nilssonii]